MALGAKERGGHQNPGEMQALSVPLTQKKPALHTREATLKLPKAVKTTPLGSRLFTLCAHDTWRIALLPVSATNISVADEDRLNPRDSPRGALSPARRPMTSERASMPKPAIVTTLLLSNIARSTLPALSATMTRQIRRSMHAAIPQGALNDAATPTPSTLEAAPLPARVPTFVKLEMIRMRLLAVSEI